MRTWFLAHRSQTLLALVSGLLLTITFPNMDQSWLAWFAVVPLLLALRKVNWRSGFWIGFAAGMAHYLTLVYWTVHTMNIYGHLPVFQCIFVLILLAAYLSLYPALFGLTLTRFCHKPSQLVLAAPAFWTVLELLRARLFTGFPWELLGYNQYKHPWIIQTADLFGVYGVSALILMVNATFTVIILLWLEKPWCSNRVQPRTVWISAIASTGFVALTMGYGIYRIDVMQQIAAKAPQAKVAVIQGNINQAVKWDPKFQVLTTAAYRKLSSKASAQAADLIIWPETATPFYFLHDNHLSRMVIDAIVTAKAYFIIGSPSFSVDLKAYAYHNSAFMMTPQGKLSGKYDKVHLVPFGEYVPLQRWLPFIDKMVAQVGDFKPGAAGSTLKWQQHQVGMQICYEIIFPSLARAMVKNGAHILVNITNDAWFGRTSAAHQHFSMAVFRAVENRRWLARAANTGISGFIDPCGRIVGTTPLFKETLSTAQVALLEEKSYYCRWGDWPMILLTFACATVMIGLTLGFKPAPQKPIKGIF